MQENNEQNDAFEDQVLELNSEVASLKLQLKAKDNQWNKERAILHQRIELQELQIKECKAREDNLKKMNETFLSTLSSISNETNKPVNKPLKDLNYMIEGMNFDNENSKAKRSDYIAKLEQENRSLKDQLHEKQIEFEQLSIRNDTKSKEQKDTISDLTQQVSQLMNSYQTSEIERARQIVEGEYQGQIESLKNEIERIQNECVEQMQQQKEQIQKGKDAQSEIVYQHQLKNYIEEMQMMHQAEISQIQAQWDILQRSQYQELLSAKTQKEDAENQFQKITEKLNLSIKKNKVSEDNIKAQKERYEKQIEELEKLNSQLKRSNGILQAEIQSKKVVTSLQDTDFKNQHLLEAKPEIKGVERLSVSRFSQIITNQKLRDQRTPTASQEPKQRPAKSKERSSEQYGIIQNVNLSTQEGFSHVQVGNLKSELSTNITPRQHFKSMTESDRPLSMRSSSGRHFDFPIQQAPEEKPKRAARIQKNRSSPKQLVPIQGSIIGNNPFAGMIIQKVSNKNEDSKSNLTTIKQSLNGSTQPNLMSKQLALKTQSPIIENQSIYKAYQQLSSGNITKTSQTEAEQLTPVTGIIIGSPKSSVSKEREYPQEVNYNSVPYFYPQQNKIESSSSHQFKNLLISRDVHKKMPTNQQIAQSFQMQNQNQISDNQNQIGISPISFTKSNSVEKRIFFKQQLDRGGQQNAINSDKVLVHNQSTQLISKSERQINEKHRQLLSRPNTSKSPNSMNDQIQSRKDSAQLRNGTSSSIQNYSSINLTSQKDFEHLLNHQLEKHV